jgi:hypothetical protein
VNEPVRKREKLIRLWNATALLSLATILGASAIAAKRPSWVSPAGLMWPVSVLFAVFACVHLAYLSHTGRRVLWALDLLGCLTLLGGLWWGLAHYELRW